MNRIITEILGRRRADAERSQLAARLWVAAEARGSLTFDSDFLREMGVGRSRALSALCDLLLAERVHLRSDEEGRVVVMSNYEFMRHILDRADEPLDEPASAETMEDDFESDSTRTAAFIAEIRPPLPETEAAAGIFDAIPPRLETDDDWFSLDVETGSPGDPDDGTILPAGRHFLPERKRDPWLVFEENEAEDEKNMGK